MTKQKIGLLFLGLSIISLSYAQKKPLTHDVYDDWKSVNDAQISKSSKYVLYTVSPQQGDALSRLTTPDQTNILQIPRGFNLSLTDDEQYLVSLIKAPFAQTRQAKIKKKKATEMPKDSLLIFHIAQNTTSKFPNVKSFKLPRHASTHLAFLSECPAAVKDSVALSANEKKSDKTEAVLSVLNLATGDTTNIAKVDAYQWSEDGKQLVYSIKSTGKDSLNESGLFILNVPALTKKKISSGKGNYKSFTFDDAFSQLTFLADKTPEKSLLKEFNLYYYTANQDTAVVLANRHSTGMPQNWFVSGHGELKFSKSGTRLYFGLAPIPKVKDTTLVEFEHAKLDVWHWKDEYLQPMQLANLKRDQTTSYTAVLNLKTNRTILPLSDQRYNRISLTPNADETWALATSDKPYRIESQWIGRAKSDIYVVSTVNGQHKKIAQANAGSAYLSPNGEYVVYFNGEDSNWYSYHIASEATNLLNDGVPVSFVDEKNDVPSYARPYGIAAWSEDGKNIYVNDRYDIWKFSLDGRKKSILTQSHGRQQQIVYRLQELYKNDDPRITQTLISEREPIFLNGFNEETKYQGLYRLNGRRIKELWSTPHSYSMVSADKNLKKVIFTREDYQHAPDLYVSQNFKDQTRLTHINAQQEDYNWGTAELISWTTPNGFPSQGILYKPEDFDPNKKYPIIAYFYETLSDGLYKYQAPAPTPSRLNIPYFVSNGYLVFAPDIHYQTGYPGKAAEEFVNSGMHYLARNNSWVDSTKMGIQGQSWGGYQVAHLITRTDMYTAAWAGAPVVNMTSAYGGIRWGSGMSRQFQYERTQSRIGKPLWDAKELYLENSPLFYMDKVNTPVAIMHNDNDGAVPWYQGIEFFTALRRLSKPVWLLNYNGDNHNLMLRQNRKDIQIREAQFFDHFLKGEPAADWISRGVKAIDKGIDWGLNISQPE
ncbi:prolyl oligopeptidase family serine peptidase [Sphingobacterium sp. JB170]|uniref:S9 family peptidase n=1 Tax=Sphingobacterium sp. JB170 TaxID=1434842 RepID=UPI00097EC3D5|nr:prolyl oligopeptidase family serine peptidase [Sphingobacterium sp. JB170]SJN49333.1 probable acylaminoacyl-peptidase [Sphingobacterium sp. JB170]